MIDTGHIQEVISPAESQDGFDALVSVLAFRVGRGFVQVLADPASDLRQVLLYNLSGRLVSARSLNAPWGLAAVDESRSVLVGLRGFTRPEVVLYSYSWPADVLVDSTKHQEAQ